VLGEGVDVFQRGAGLVVVRGEDEGVGGVADAGLLVAEELGGAHLLERLDDPSVSVCAF
jgi:hypothetical protein